MPPGPTPRREATLRRILDTAWQLSREQGLTGWTLRDLGAAVGMRAPSLYGYVAGKHALYDALFADGYRALLRRIELARRTPGDPHQELRAATRLFIDFCVEDPARYQLLFLRTIPGFEPSPQSYRLALEVWAVSADVLRAAGFTDPAELDLWSAVTTGLASQQISNDPGGRRWADLVDKAVDRFLLRVG